MSDLEMLVNNDMYELGFDPTDQNDIMTYWEMMLG